MKAKLKDAQRNGTRPQASGGPVTSTSRLNHPNRPTSIGLHSNEANTIGGTPGRPTSLATMPNIRCSVVSLFWSYVPLMFPLVLLHAKVCSFLYQPGKSRTVNATDTCTPTESSP